MHSHHPARLLAYVGTVSVVAVGGLAWSWVREPVQLSVVLVVLAATMIISDAFFSVTLPSGATVTVSFALQIAVLLLEGPTALAVLFTVVAVASRLIARVTPFGLSSTEHRWPSQALSLAGPSST